MGRRARQVRPAAVDPRLRPLAADAVADVRDRRRGDDLDGLILDTPDGERFVDAPQVADLYERLVVLEMTAEDARQLPEPSASPASVNLSPDDIAGDTRGDKVRDAAKRAWDRISGNY